MSVGVTALLAITILLVEIGDVVTPSQPIAVAFILKLPWKPAVQSRIPRWVKVVFAPLSITVRGLPVPGLTEDKDQVMY